MAIVTLRDEDRVLDCGAVADFLAPFGIRYQRFAGERAPAEGASDEEILAVYDEPIRKWMAEGGYRSADVVQIRPDLPDLDAMLAKFDREHTHDEDEVRFIASGRGLFHVNPEGGPVFCIEVVAGDLISVPAGTRHWFHVCEARRCHAIRLFQDAAGWTPHYTGTGIELSYPPVWQGAAPA